MGPFEKEFEAAGEVYKFRLPSAQDLIDVDLKALQMRKGVTDGLNNGYMESQNAALLQTLYKGDAKVDFSTLPAFVVDYLAEEVSKWEKSFREGLGQEKEPSSP